MARGKLVFLLRTRFTDDEPWSEPTVYTSRRERDEDAAMARAWAGIRTHSYEERRSSSEGSDYARSEAR